MKGSHITGNNFCKKRFLKNLCFLFSFDQVTNTMKISFQVEYFSGTVIGQVKLDTAKLQDKKHVSQQVSALLPEGMGLAYALIKKQENLIMAVPKRLPLQMEFPEAQVDPALSPCGKFVTSGGAADNFVKVWTLGTQECTNLEGHTHCVSKGHGGQTYRFFGFFWT